MCRRRHPRLLSGRIGVRYVPIGGDGCRRTVPGQRAGNDRQSRVERMGIEVRSTLRAESFSWYTYYLQRAGPGLWPEDLMETAVCQRRNRRGGSVDPTYADGVETTSLCQWISIAPNGAAPAPRQTLGRTGVHAVPKGDPLEDRGDPTHVAAARSAEASAEADGRTSVARPTRSDLSWLSEGDRPVVRPICHSPGDYPPGYTPLTPILCEAG